MTKKSDEIDLRKPEDMAAVLSFYTGFVKATNKKQNPPAQQQDQGQAAAAGTTDQPAGKDDNEQA